MTALRAEIEEMFAALEGCADRAALGGFLYIDNNQRQRDRYARDGHDINAAKRKKRLQDNIKKWATDAKMILLGREVPSQGDYWANTLRNPITPEERAAQVDFIHFLRKCRRCTTKVIAGMLGITEDAVNEALRSRGA